MEITQSDRDTLRASQHKLNPKIIGNIIEHKTQDPKKYKQSSKIAPSEQNGKTQTLLPDEAPEPLQINYERKYLNHEQNDCLSTIKEVRDKELPDDTKELQANSWLNMTQIEFDKLEWMSSKAEKIHREKLETTTQFDKDGRAVSIVKSSTKGEDPSNVEGTHDIQSLFKLLDSTYSPQITYSLTVITRIASLASMGYYDGAFDGNIHEILLKGCLLRVRHHMDSSNETICLAALKCLRALLCNTQVDEVILDRTYPLMSQDVDSNLWLHTYEMDSKEFTIEMKDSECVEVDAVLSLVARTDLLKRFSYLLENKTGRLGFAYYECILDILIRTARHSPTVCFIISSKGLIPFIIRTFLPSTIMTEPKHVLQLSIKALKLMRIMAQAAYELQTLHENGSNCCINTRIFNDLISLIEIYFTLDCYSFPPEESDLFFKLHIETLRTMKALCKLESFQAKIISVIAMSHDKLVKDLRIISLFNPKKNPDSKISTDWQYAGHLIDLIGSIMCSERFHNIETNTDIYWSSLIKPILFRWITEVVRLKCIPHLDVSIAIAASIQQIAARQDRIAIEDLHRVLIQPIINETIESKGECRNLFTLLAQTASERSLLHNFTQQFGCLRDPKGLPSYGCLCYNLSPQYNFKLSPLFENDSPFILLNSFIQQLPRKPEITQSHINILVDSLIMNRYIRSIIGYHKYQTDYESMVQQSFIAQYEIQLIGHSLLLLGGKQPIRVPEGEKNAKEVQIESENIASNHIECYSNLCYYTISAIGVMNMRASHLVLLKDKLFERILLNATLQEKLLKENNIKDISEWSLDWAIGGNMLGELSDAYINILTPLYTSSDQPNRFWIFQPLLDYYFDCIKSYENQGDQKDKEELLAPYGEKGFWFRDNIHWRSHTGEAAGADDSTTVTSILAFNSIMMLCSRSYLHQVIKPDIEDYLCLLGVLFLDDDLFLHEKVNRSLTVNLRIILNECYKPTSKCVALFKDASKIIKPLDLALADFFTKLVDQFEAVSYGDDAFSNFLLLFITPHSDIVFRKKLFQEKSETCLSQIRLGLENVWTPKELFMGVKEKDPEMRELIRRSGAFIQKGSFLSRYRTFHLSS